MLRKSQWMKDLRGDEGRVSTLYFAGGDLDLCFNVEKETT